MKYILIIERKGGEMLNKKILIIIVSAVTLIAILAIGIPVFASDAQGTANPASINQVNKARILARLLLVKDEAKVDAFIAKAVADNKLNQEQATKLKAFWTEHHAQFVKNQVLIRLLQTKDEARVKAFLDKAVKSGKLQQERADRIIQAWEILHTPVPAAK
jgi:uncharacterized membrane protein